MAKVKMLHTKAEVVSKGIKADEGVIDAVVGSSNVLDRAGDIIDQSGWLLKGYKTTNPVILWGHNVREERPPIGKALKVWLQDKGEKNAKLMFKVKFDLQDNFASEIFRKIKDGFINTVSVGFLPLEWEELEKDNPYGGRRYIKQELLELSFVPVPANPEALVALKGMKDKRFNPIELKELYPAKEKAESEVPTDKGKEEVAKEKEEEGPKVEKVIPEEKTKVEPKEEKFEIKKVKLEEEVKEEPKEEKLEVKEEPKAETKGVIGFKDLDVAPESEPWDGKGEKMKAEITDLKIMCAWFDSEKPGVKSSYKLPHHKAEGYKAVWRGVAASMASLLGARGGVNIPVEDQKGVYNHLKKHYEQFDKTVPDFKAIEDQVLAGFDNEIHALILDREDRHTVKLIKKVLKRQNEEKKEKEEKEVSEYTPEQVKSALEVLSLALSQISVDLPKGGEQKG